MHDLYEINIHTYCAAMTSYLAHLDLGNLPRWNEHKKFSLTPLAQGEYNMNFLLSQGRLKYVVRVNTGSQIGKSLPDQIRYEYETLKMLEPAGVTPMVHMLDASCQHIPYGVLIMEYLAGEKLDYLSDNQTAAKLFAAYHQLPIENPAHLIIEEHPLSLTYERCLLMAPKYWESPLADPEVAAYLKEIFAWAEQAKHRERYFIEDRWQCIINTEVNNGNFIKNIKKGTLHLVDWEKPLWGDPSQDLSHYSVPTTTLWKTNYRMSEAERNEMMQAYKASLNDKHLQDTIEERTRLRDPFNCLRGVSWCAMAWVQYQTGRRTLRNQDTWPKLSMYVDRHFLHELFDPFMKG
jgi:aminoglycoside phosphotransferase (APT) family kinase protein